MPQCPIFSDLLPSPAPSLNEQLGALQELRLAIKAAFADWDRRLRDGSPGAARGLRTTLGSNGVTMCLSCDQPVTHPRNVPGSQPTAPDKGGGAGDACVLGQLGVVAWCACCK